MAAAFQIRPFGLASFRWAVSLCAITLIFTSGCKRDVRPWLIENKWVLFQITESGNLHPWPSDVDDKNIVIRFTERGLISVKYSRAYEFKEGARVGNVLEEGSWSIEPQSNGLRLKTSLKYGAISGDFQIMEHGGKTLALGVIKQPIRRDFGLTYHFVPLGTQP